MYNSSATKSFSKLTDMGQLGSVYMAMCQMTFGVDRFLIVVVEQRIAKIECVLSKFENND